MDAARRSVWRSPFLLFTLILWGKFALLRAFLFEGVTVKWWLLDLASLVVITGLLEAVTPAKAKRLAFWLLNAVLSVVFFAATLYYEHFGSVVTYTSVLEMKQLLQISSSVKATLRPLDYLFFADFLVFFIIWLAIRMLGGRLFTEFRYRSSLLLALCLLGITVSAWFIKFDTAIVNELVRAEQLGLVNYQVSVAVNGRKEMKETNFANMTQAQIVIRRFEEGYPYGKQTGSNGNPAYFASQKGKNLIVVQMEAFQRFLIHLNYNGHELTPVLNKLAGESYYFPNIFQQIGQGNTSDAEFMSNTSLYPTGTIPMSTGYGDRSLPSLPKLLEGNGYEADTFHVNDVHFWDRIKLYPAIGFSHYFDKPYYNNDNFNEFGASDEELFRVGVEKLSALAGQHKPFYAQFITVSSHFPFKVPANFRKMTIPASLEGKQLGDYLLATNYTDYAIGTFIDKLKAAGLWDTSIFVAYGDHFGLQPQDNDPQTVGSELGITYHPEITRFNIPLFIHVPGQQKGKQIDQVGGQLDILPTIANLLGLSLDNLGFVHFGQDLFNIRSNVFGMRYYMPTGSFFNNDIMFTPGKGFEDGTATSLKTLQTVDRQPYRNDFDYVMTLMKMSDAYVKILPKRQ